jgi:hypothetical protein
MVVAIAMFALVAVALQSAVLLASKALPDRNGVGANQLAATRFAERINSELTYALNVTELTATSIAFTVADRDNDAAEETIRYAWSGVAGDPITRQYNGGKQHAALDDAREFALAYDRRAELQPATYTESAESILYNNTGGLLNVDFAVTKDDFCGQYFVPTLPNNTAYWRITRVRYYARRHSGDTGIAFVQVRTATANGQPESTVIDQATLRENSLDSSYAISESSFSSATGLAPNGGACIVFRWVNDADACDVLNKTLTLALLGGHKFISTSNAGTSWSGNAFRVMPLIVYGRSATKDPDQYKYYLQSVRLNLRAGADATARVCSSARILATPEVSAP